MFRFLFRVDANVARTYIPCYRLMLGHPLKKMLFPVQRPGEHITAEWELFYFFWSTISSFSYQKKPPEKKKDFAAARVAIISATRWTGNKLFFKGGLTSGVNAEQNLNLPMVTIQTGIRLLCYDYLLFSLYIQKANIAR